MREASLTDGRWRPLAQHLAVRFAGTGGADEEMVQAAIAVIVDAERRLGSPRPDFSVLVVPLVIRALRRRRHDRIRNRLESVQPYPALQLAMASAEGELSRRLRRPPTVADVAECLNLGEHQIVAGLEAGWSAGMPATATR